MWPHYGTVLVVPIALHRLHGLHQPGFSPRPHVRFPFTCISWTNRGSRKKHGIRRELPQSCWTLLARLLPSQAGGGHTKPKGNSWSRELRGHSSLCYQRFPGIHEITALTLFSLMQNEMSLDISAQSRATHLLDQGLNWITPAAQTQLCMYKRKPKEVTAG